jgi:hypothetical protein
LSRRHSSDGAWLRRVIAQAWVIFPQFWGASLPK